MRKTLFLFFLLASLLNQAAASAHGFNAHTPPDLAHAMLHWDEKLHHHHDDGSLHVDASDDSSDHMNAEAASNLPVVVSSDLLTPSLDAPTETTAFQPSAPPSPALKALKRPPRLPT